MRTLKRLLTHLWVWVIILLGVVYFGGDRIAKSFDSVFTKSQLLQQRDKLEIIENTAQFTYDEMRKLLAATPDAARVRLATIHTNNGGVPRYDVNYAMANPGHDPGNLVTNQPLTLFRDYLDDLIANKCAFIKFTETSNKEEIVLYARNNNLTNYGFLACPVQFEKTLVGVLFLTWAQIDKIPADLAPTIERMRQTTAQLGRINPSAKP